jgi:hypothetical protein
LKVFHFSVLGFWWVGHDLLDQFEVNLLLEFIGEISFTREEP